MFDKIKKLSAIFLVEAIFELKTLTLDSGVFRAENRRVQFMSITVIRHNLHKISQNWRVQLAFLKNRRVHLHPSHLSKDATENSYSNSLIQANLLGA